MLTNDLDFDFTLISLNDLAGSERRIIRMYDFRRNEHVYTT